MDEIRKIMDELKKAGINEMEIPEEFLDEVADETIIHEWNEVIGK